MSITSDLIRKHEGVRLHVYLDTMGKRTVGVGFNLDAPGAAAVCEACGLSLGKILADEYITQEQSDAIFAHQLDAVETQARLTFKNYDAMPADVQAVIADMIFNLGFVGFLGFHKAVLALKGGDWKGAADQLTNSAWFHQVGDRATEDIALLRAA